MKYYQISFTLEKSIRGNHEMPHTISIESKEFLRYNLEKNKTISMYFENKKSLYDEMPDNLRGKLINREGVIDFMDFTQNPCLFLLCFRNNRYLCNTRTRQASPTMLKCVGRFIFIKSTQWGSPVDGRMNHYGIRQLLDKKDR